MRVVGRRKHHLRQLLQSGQHFKARKPWQLNVQKHEVRPQGMNGVDGLGAVAGFPHEFIAGLLAHVLPQQLPGVRLVIDQQHPLHRLKWARTPRGSLGVRCNVALHSFSSRSWVFCKPTPSR